MTLGVEGTQESVNNLIPSSTGSVVLRSTQCAWRWTFAFLQGYLVMQICNAESIAGLLG